MKRFFKYCLLFTLVLLLVFSVTSCLDDGDKPYVFTEERFDSIDKTLYLHNGHYYALYEESLHWTDAEKKCEEIGGHLVTITSEEENAFIKKLLNKANISNNDMPSFFSGGFQENGEWVWITGESWNFFEWGPRQPDNTGSRLAIWNSEYNFTWDDLSNDLKRYYICEWESKDMVGENSYYLTKKILNVDDFLKISGSSDSYVLFADIDLSGIEEWQPIENFSGKLDGLGHKITGLKFETTNSANIGLFATLSGEVKNLIIENALITAKGKSEKAGILAGTSTGAIENVTVSGTVNAKYYDYVGGIVGFCDGGKIISSTNNASVIGANMTGGVAGYVAVGGQDFVKNITNNADVTAEEKVGGVFGIITGRPVSGTFAITELTNCGEVNGESYVGGIVGEVYGAHFPTGGGYWAYNYFDFSLLENKAEVTGTDLYVGGLVGHATQLNTLTVSKNSADISGADYVGGFIGHAEGTYINASDAPNDSMISGKTYVGGFAGLAGVIEGAVNNGQITATGVKNQGTYIGGIAGYCKGLIKCKNTSDIISTTSGAYTGGLAGFVNLANADSFKKNENLALISGADFTGGIAGELINVNGGETYFVSDSKNYGPVSGKSFVGGIIGSASGAHYSTSGGYWTYNYITATALENSGEITATGDYAGGIFGRGFKVTEINTSYNNSDIKGGSYVGGLIGCGEDTYIFATGETSENTITGKSYVGGFAGVAGAIEDAVNNGDIISIEATIKDNSSVAYVGGIAGFCTALIKCTNTADISVSTGGMYTGGLAGYLVTRDENSITGNTNIGAINGADYTGGIAGYTITKAGGSIYNNTGNKNSGSINGTKYVGGIVGFASGVNYSSGGHGYKNYFAITYCENTAAVSGSSFVGGIVGGSYYLNTEQMDTNTDITDRKIGVES